jgi:hypothetical protein
MVVDIFMWWLDWGRDRELTDVDGVVGGKGKV